MQWHLDQYRKTKQGLSIFKRFIGNTDRALILPIYETFLSSCSSFTSNEIPAAKALAEIYTARLHFLTSNPTV